MAMVKLSKNITTYKVEFVKNVKNIFIIKKNELFSKGYEIIFYFLMSKRMRWYAVIFSLLKTVDVMLLCHTFIINITVVININRFNTVGELVLLII